MIQVLFARVVPKFLGAPQECEDCWIFNPDSGVGVLGDGASESYDSKTWIQILCQGLSSQPSAGDPEFQAWAREFDARVRPSADTWAKEAAFERGSFGAYLQVVPQGKDLVLRSVGDVEAVFLPAGGGPPLWFPYQKSEEFLLRPWLVSSLPGIPIPLREHRIHRQSGTLLLMTDALAHFCMNLWERGAPILQKLLKTRDPLEFDRLIESLRKRKWMRRDDGSLVHIKWTED